MTTHNKTLQMLAAKLGLKDEEKVIRKAAELERLLQTKTIAGNNITDTSKMVICLELATNICGVDLDVKTAIKYSGLKQPTYINTRKIVENLLELNSDKVTIPNLCLILQCANVQRLAEEILAEYQRTAKMEIDLNLPQYVCMAVYQACRVRKVKISKSKVIEKSHLKPGQWTKLDAEWSKLVNEKFANARKKNENVNKESEENDVREKIEVDTSIKVESSEQQVEPYEDWKRRILEQAYKELRAHEQLEKNQKIITPRKSPRKTPQKSSPYKVDNKVGSVRLLFPKNTRY